MYPFFNYNKLCYVCGLLFLLFSFAGALEEEHEVHLLNVVFSDEIFNEVNGSDALASLRVWTNQVFKSHDVDAEVVVNFASSPNSIAEGLRTESIDLLVISTLDYLELGELKDKVEPFLVPSWYDGSAFEEYVLVVRKDSNKRSWGELKDAHLKVLKANGAHFTDDWLERSLDIEGYEVETHLSRVDAVNKATLAVLPVFFGKADACIVSRRSYELVCELNPQVERELELILASPPVVEVVLCIRANYEYERDLIIKTVIELDQDPAGQQLLLVFKVASLIPFEERYLEGSKTLLGLTGSSDDSPKPLNDQSGVLDE